MTNEAQRREESELMPWLGVRKCNCKNCGIEFEVDVRGRRQRDWVICDAYCCIWCNMADISVQEGKSVYEIAMAGADLVAEKMIRNIVDIWSFKRGVAQYHIERLDKKLRALNDA